MLEQILQAIPFSFAALFPVLNPLGSAVIFLALTRGASHAVQNRLALKVAINTFILLVTVLITGAWVLRFFGITIPVVQIGGGIVVALIGWRVLNQSTDTQSGEVNVLQSDKIAKEMAFFPLTMPLTAGPGCIAVTLTIGAHQVTRVSFITTLWRQMGAIIGIFLASVLVFFCYRYASRVTHYLGHSGKQVITRLFAFLNLCIGIQIMWHGIHSLFKTLI